MWFRPQQMQTLPWRCESMLIDDVFGPILAPNFSVRIVGNRNLLFHPPIVVLQPKKPVMPPILLPPVPPKPVPPKPVPPPPPPPPRRVSLANYLAVKGILQEYPYRQLKLGDAGYGKHYAMVDLGKFGLLYYDNPQTLDDDLHHMGIIETRSSLCRYPYFDLWSNSAAWDNAVKSYGAKIIDRSAAIAWNTPTVWT